jgi:hypothetical protein
VAANTPQEVPVGILVPRWFAAVLAAAALAAVGALTTWGWNLSLGGHDAASRIKQLDADITEVRDALAAFAKPGARFTASDATSYNSRYETSRPSSVFTCESTRNGALTSVPSTGAIQD